MTDYSEVLYNFSEISIAIENLRQLFDIDDVKSVNEDINSLLKQLKVRTSCDKLYLRKDGLYIYSKDLIKNIFKALSMPQAFQQALFIEELIKKQNEGLSIDEILMITRGKIDSKILFDLIASNYTEDYLNNKKVEKENIAKFKEHFNLPRYWKLDIDGITDNLRLYVAGEVLEYTKRALDNKEYKKYRIGIEYLKAFIQNNSELIKSSLSITIGNGKSKKQYSTIEIMSYMKGFMPRVEPEKKMDENVQVEKMNYTFFPQDLIESKYTLKNMLANIKQTEPKELKALLIRKINFYSSLPYIRVQIGQESFDGYIGFELPNGLVILDKFYDDLISGKIARNYAIYIVDKSDFVSITKMNRRRVIELIENGTISAQRVIHGDNFEEKVKNVVKI